jgi:N-acetylglutamate synthase-like GNAT family acetyltransferase
MNNERTNKPVSIRPYRQEDLEACRVLWVELTEWHRMIYESPGIGGSDPGRQFDEHLSRVGPENIWVAEINEQIVGIAGLIPSKEETELEPVVVRNEYRGLGIGRKLTETVITAAREQGFRQLKVRPVARNETAIRFLHELGFNVLGHVELFLELSSPERNVWKPGERLAGKEFRV